MVTFVENKRKVKKGSYKYNIKSNKKLILELKISIEMNRSLDTWPSDMD